MGFNVWVAELELLVGTARGTRPLDQQQCFELLQRLSATIEGTDRGRLRDYQRKCEEGLVAILFKGAAPPVSPVDVLTCLLWISFRSAAPFAGPSSCNFSWLILHHA